MSILNLQIEILKKICYNIKGGREGDPLLSNGANKISFLKKPHWNEAILNPVKRIFLLLSPGIFKKHLKPSGFIL